MSPGFFLKNCLEKEKKIPRDFSGFIASAINAEKNSEHLSGNIMILPPHIKMMDQLIF